MKFKKRLSFIAALSENRVIGVQNQLPWNIPADLKKFREWTSGNAVIMGRKTWDSIGRALPKRTNIVVTRQKGWPAPAEGVLVASSLDEARQFAEKAPGEEVFLLGGGELFSQSLSQADRLVLTLIHRHFEGDAYFPSWNAEEFKEVYAEALESEPPATFKVFERINLPKQEA